MIAAKNIMSAVVSTAAVHTLSTFAAEPLADAYVSLSHFLFEAHNNSHIEQPVELTNTHNELFKKQSRGR